MDPLFLYFGIKIIYPTLVEIFGHVIELKLMFDIYNTYKGGAVPSKRGRGTVENGLSNTRNLRVGQGK